MVFQRGHQGIEMCRPEFGFQFVHVKMLLRLSQFFLISNLAYTPSQRKVIAESEK